MRYGFVFAGIAGVILMLSLCYWLLESPSLSLSSTNTQFPASGWNYQRLKSLIISKKLARISDVLVALKEEDPDLLSRYVAAYDSNSGQGATRAKPRVIPFSSDGSLFFSFTGLKTDPGYSNLEVMVFDLDEGYRLFEIHFPAEGSHRQFADNEIDETYSFAVFSKPNPFECLMCHNSTVRPIWAQYAKWPRMYGEDDDYYFMGGKSVVKDWMKDLRYKVLDKEYPKQTTSLDAFYTPPELVSRERLAKKPIKSFYRRNLVVTRIFSWQLTELLVRDVARQGAQANASLNASLGCGNYSSGHPNVEAQLNKQFSTISTAPRIQTAILPMGLSVRNYVPLKAHGDPEGFADGKDGFRYLTDILIRKQGGLRLEMDCDEWQKTIDDWINSHPDHDLL